MTVKRRVHLSALQAWYQPDFADHVIDSIIIISVRISTANTMPGWEVISNDLREVSFTAHQPGEGHKVTSKTSEVSVSNPGPQDLQCCTFGICSNLPEKGWRPLT